MVVQLRAGANSLLSSWVDPMDLNRNEMRYELHDLGSFQRKEVVHCLCVIHGVLFVVFLVSRIHCFFLATIHVIITSLV